MVSLILMVQLDLLFLNGVKQGWILQKVVSLVPKKGMRHGVGYTPLAIQTHAGRQEVGA